MLTTQQSQLREFALADLAFHRRPPSGSGDAYEEIKVTNIIRGVNWLFEDNLTRPRLRDLSVDLCHELHLILSAQPSDNAEQQQQQQTPLATVTRKLKKLMKLIELCNQRILQKDHLSPDCKLAVAAYFLHRFLAIRPYSGGNGRTARLVTSLLLAHLQISARTATVTVPLRFDLPKDSCSRYWMALRLERALSIVGPESEELAQLANFLAEVDRLTRRDLEAEAT